MELISKFNNGIRVSLWVIDIFSKYAWVIPLKDKKGILITNALQKTLNESNCKPNQTLLSKPWFIGQIWTIPKYTKKEYTIVSGTRKNTTSQTPSSILYLDDWTWYFRHRYTIKLSKNKMDSKVIKIHQCSLEIYHAVSIELILNYNQGLTLFR